VKGVAGLLCEFYSGHAPAEILACEPSFLREAGITQHLTPNRRNGLARVWERIRDFAQSHLAAGEVEPRMNQSAMRFFDAHNHLQDERFGGRKEELVAECRRAGIAQMVVNGACERDWPQVADLAQRHPDLIVPGFGYHPWYLGERTADWQVNLRKLLDATPNAVVGEIGLDRWKPDLPYDGQEEAFAWQLRLAAERNVAASIHCLKAWGRLHDLLRANPQPARGFLLHSYGGPAEMVAPLAKLGAYFSFPGYYLHERKARQRETFKLAPPDRLLVETDAPDQSLPDVLNAHPLTNNTTSQPLNHPANLPAIYRGLADVLGESVDSLATRVAENFARLFG
jgi:TatD DNase family protein